MQSIISKIHVQTGAGIRHISTASNGFVLMASATGVLCWDPKSNEHIPRQMSDAHPMPLPHIALLQSIDVFGPTAVDILSIDSRLGFVAAGTRAGQLLIWHLHTMPPVNAAERIVEDVVLFGKSTNSNLDSNITSILEDPAFREKALLHYFRRTTLLPLGRVTPMMHASDLKASITAVKIVSEKVRGHSVDPCDRVRVVSCGSDGQVVKWDAKVRHTHPRGPASPNICVL